MAHTTNATHGGITVEHRIVTRRWLATHERIVRCPVCDGEFPRVKRCDICGGEGRMRERTEWRRVRDA
jgi:rRNA maturation endonuclease Nob1